MSIGSFAWAQPTCTFSIRGKITDGETGLPLPSVVVSIQKSQTAVMTDKNGIFELPTLCHGDYSVSYTLLGYKSLKAFYHVDKNVDEQIILHTDTCHLESITIQGKTFTDLETISVKELSGKEMEETRGLSLGESLKKIPGVTSLQTGPSISKPIIHGLSGQRVLILNSGLRQEGQQWGSEHAPEIDPFMANRISIVKGAASVRYGSDALGGVVLVEPDDLPSQVGMRGNLHLVGLSNSRQGIVSGMVEGNHKFLPQFSWRVQGTLKRGGNFEAPNYFLANTGLEERNYSIQLAYKKSNWGIDLYYSQFYTKLGILLGSTFGNLTDMKAALARGNPIDSADFTYDIRRPYQEVGHSLLRIKAFYSFSNASKLELVLGRQYNDRSEYDRHLPRKADLGDVAQFIYRLTTYTADVLYHFKTWKSLSSYAGLSGVYQNNEIAGTRYFFPNFSSLGAGAFYVLAWKKDRTGIEAGIRYDVKQIQASPLISIGGIRQPYEQTSRFQNISWTLGTTYRASQHVFLKFNAGVGWRAPNVAEMYTDGVRHGGAGLERGLKIDKDANKDSLNLSILPEVSYKAVGNLNFSNPWLDLDLDIHGSYIQNFIFLRPDIGPNQSIDDAVELTIRGAYPLYRYTQANVVLYGADVLAQVKFTPFLSWISKVSLVRSWNYTQNDYLIFTPADRFENGLKFQIPNFHSLTENYITFSNLSVRRQTLAPQNQDFATPPPGYSLFNLDAGTTLVFGKQEIHVGMSVHNIFNSSYRDYLDRFRYFADSPGRTFVLRLRIPFELAKTKHVHGG